MEPASIDLPALAARLRPLACTLRSLTTLGLLTLSVGVLALWERSIRYEDHFSFPITADRFLGTESLRGEVCVFSAYYVAGYYGPEYGRAHPWLLRSDEVRGYQRQAQEAAEFRGVGGLGFNWSPPLYVVAAPHWFVALVFAALAFILKPKPRLKVSLADLLVLMTFSAVLIAGVAGLSRLTS